MPAISSFETLIPDGYGLRSNSQATFSPVSVVVAAIRLTITSWLTSGRPRQFWLMNEKSRCSILFHLLVPGGKWHTEIRSPVSLARRWSSSFQSRTRDPLLPPPSAVISNDLASVLGSAHRAPPPPDALHREGRRVVIRPHVDPAGV